MRWPAVPGKPKGYRYQPQCGYRGTFSDTQDFDHGKKFMLYRQIPTLKEHILISSMETLVEKFIRHDHDAWTLTEYKSMADKISIDTIGYQTTLSEIYRDVVFEENAGIEEMTEK